MGEGPGQAFQVDFDGLVKMKFRGAKLTSDAGLLAHRELDKAVQLTGSAPDIFIDARTGKNTQHILTAIMIARFERTMLTQLENVDGLVTLSCQ